jgi:hypothetical protein
MTGVFSLNRHVNQTRSKALDISQNNKKYVFSLQGLCKCYGEL